MSQTYADLCAAVEELQALHVKTVAAVSTLYGVLQTSGLVTKDVFDRAMAVVLAQADQIVANRKDGGE